MLMGLSANDDIASGATAMSFKPRVSESTRTCQVCRPQAVSGSRNISSRITTGGPKSQKCRKRSTSQHDIMPYTHCDTYTSHPSSCGEEDLGVRVGEQRFELLDELRSRFSRHEEYVQSGGAWMYEKEPFFMHWRLLHTFSKLKVSRKLELCASYGGLLQRPACDETTAESWELCISRKWHVHCQCDVHGNE